MSLEIVLEGHECPDCKENRVDYLVWIDYNDVECQSCKNVYQLC